LKPAELFPVLASDLAEVDAVIRLHLSSEVALINQVSDYIVNAGGKRLRPLLLLLIARALGHRSVAEGGNGHHSLLAAVVEFIHTATLLHDDVVDESDLRRGRRTANAAFGNAASVLVGDFLYSRAFQMMVSVNDLAVMGTLADATNTIAEGEVLQLLNCNDPEVDEARYLKVIQYKTAKLFEASAVLGGLITGATPEVIQAAAEYGRRVGTAFQLIDDALDYSGDPAALGKNVGDDLREGKVTLPLIHVLKNGTAGEKALVEAAIRDGHTAEFDAIHHAVERCGSLHYTRELAQSEAQAARDCVARILGQPDASQSEYGRALLHFASFAVGRDR
jgi:octaprenyl-diphosphate synthase